MKVNDNSVIGLLALLGTLMLLIVLIGDSVAVHIRATAYSICILSTVGILMLRNILGGSRAASIRFLYGLGIVIMLGILLAIIFLDGRFETGDKLLLGMEPATAFLVIGVSLFPYWFIALWVIGFRRAFVTPEKERRLNQLKADLPENKENVDG